MDAEWLLTTLTDVLDTLEETIGELEASPEAIDQLLPEAMAVIYAKLNYAWNSRELGPAAIETLDHDALIAFPSDLPM